VKHPKKRSSAKSSGSVATSAGSTRRTAKSARNKTSNTTASSSSATFSSQNVANVKTGDIVACYVDQYAEEEPQIATIISIKQNNKLDVQWMHGSYSDPWLPCKRGRAMEPWIEEIGTKNLLYPLELTRSCRLPESTRKKLKLSYSQL